MEFRVKEVLHHWDEWRQIQNKLVYLIREDKNLILFIKMEKKKKKTFFNVKSIILISQMPYRHGTICQK